MRKIKAPAERRREGKCNPDKECRDPESNRGRRDFQSRALPTELSRQGLYINDL